MSRGHRYETQSKDHLHIDVGYITIFGNNIVTNLISDFRRYVVVSRITNPYRFVISVECCYSIIYLIIIIYLYKADK